MLTLSIICFLIFAVATGFAAFQELFGEGCNGSTFLLMAMFGTLGLVFFALN